MNIYLDIETIPGQSQKVRDMLAADAEREKRSIKAPGNYKDAAKISDFLEARIAEIDAAHDERWRKTALDGAFGQIVCVGVAIDDAPPVAIYREDWQAVDSERDVLEEFFALLWKSCNPSSGRHPTFIGHNIVGFDLRFIFQRAVILGVIPPPFIPFNARPWDETVFDTMVSWAGIGNRVRLDKLCDVFDLPKKGSEIGDDIDGSKVWDFVQAGRIADVADYCCGDVMRTRAIARRLTFAECAYAPSRIRAEESALLERKHAEREAVAEAQKQYDEDMARYIAAEQNSTQRGAVETVQMPCSAGGGLHGSTGELRAAGEPGIDIAKPPSFSPGVAASPQRKARPSDDEIIDVLALHFHVHESIVVGWLYEIDLEAASQRIATEINL